MVTSLNTYQVYVTPGSMATIAGTPVVLLSAQTQHGVERTTGTATLVVDAPDYDATQLREKWLNRVVEVQAGYHEYEGAQRIFHGRVESLERDFDQQVRIRCGGWSRLLDFESQADITFPGNTSLYDIFRALCNARKLPLFGGSPIVMTDGTTPIRLGGVSYFSEGKITIPRRSSWLQWMASTASLFGYACYDRPDGYFWWQRVSGLPPGAASAAFTQGSTLLEASRGDDLGGRGTWFDVTGASGTDNDGIAVKVRSFPASVPPDPGLYQTPPGYKRKPINSNLLVTQALADEVRNVNELSYSVPYERETWRYRNYAPLQPGSVAQITASVLELSAAKRWVMTVDHSVSQSGLFTTWSGWAGGGTALAAGIDSNTISVISGPVHLGDETLPHYAVPAPSGKVREFNITIPDEYTAITIEGLAHGCNSYMLQGANAESEVSKIEVWQGGGDKPIGTANLPTLAENLAQALDYTNLANWTSFRIPVPGNLSSGVAKVKVIAGEDKRALAGYRIDDFEVRSVNIVLTGVGTPMLPEGGS